MTQFERFAQQQKELNPSITDAEIERLWEQQPLSKRIASGIESAVALPTKIPSAIKSALSAPNPLASDKLKANISTEGLWNKNKPTESAPTAMTSAGPAEERTEVSAQEEARPTASAPSPIKSPLSTALGKIAEAEQPADLSKLSNLELGKQIGSSIGQLDAAAKDTDTPPDLRKQLREERLKAEELFDKAKTRNEWLELAQLVAQAATQYGAAQLGYKTGRVLTGFQIPDIDYGARTDRAERSLERKVRNIREQEQDIDQAKKEADRAAKDERDFQLRKQSEERQEKYQQGLLDVQRGELGVKKQKAAQPEPMTPEERQEAKEERFESEKKLKATRNILGALDTLSGKASTETKQDAIEIISKNLGDAKLSRDLQKKVSKLQEGKPRIFDSEWQENFNKVSSELEAELSTGQPSTGPVTVAPGTQPAAPAAAPAAGGMVTVIHKATGQARQFPANSPEAQRAKSDPEFEVK